MESNPLVSVIIPVYNKSHCIENTISSVLKQRYKNFEIIIVDDGSIDNSKDVIQKIVATDERCKYFYKTNGGVSSARNYGLDNASGEFISFLDADDTYDADFLQKMVAASKCVNFVFCGHLISYPDTLKKRKSKINFKTKDFLLDYLLNKTTPNTNSWLISSKFLNDNLLRFEESLSWGEDMLFFSTVAFHADSYKSCAGYYTQYNMYNEASLTRSFDYERKIDSDIVWLNKLHYVIASSKNKNNVSKYLSAINQYRKPATVIYNMTSMLNESAPLFVKDLYRKYSCEISRIGLNNGLRSLKLYFYYFYLRLRILG